MGTVSFVLLLAVLLAGCIGETCATIQRLHRLDRPGIHIVLLAIPIYNRYLERACHDDVATS